MLLALSNMNIWFKVQDDVSTRIKTMVQNTADGSMRCYQIERRGDLLP